MNGWPPSPAVLIGAVLLLVVTVAAIAFLPNAGAWALLGQVAASAARMVAGAA